MELRGSPKLHPIKHVRFGLGFLETQIRGKPWISDPKKTRVKWWVFIFTNSISTNCRFEVSFLGRSQTLRLSSYTIRCVDAFDSAGFGACGRQHYPQRRSEKNLVQFPLKTAIGWTTSVSAKGASFLGKKMLKGFYPAKTILFRGHSPNKKATRLHFFGEVLIRAAGHSCCLHNVMKVYFLQTNPSGSKIGPQPKCIN